MSPSELLRMCAEKMEQFPDTPALWDLKLVHPRYSGRFAFAGGGTEVACATEEHTVYFVPIDRVLSCLSKLLKESRKP